MQSDLTLPLALLGAAVVAGVLVHGWWQARRVRPQPPERSSPKASAPGDRPKAADGGARATADSALPDTRPWEDPVADPAQPPAADPGARLIEPILLDAVSPPRPVPGASTAAVTRPSSEPAQIDALIDAVATLAVNPPVSGDAAMAHLPASRRAGSKPFRIEGLNAETGRCEALRPGQRYSELQAGVQLANRKGPINEIEYSEFVQKVQDYCDAVGAIPDFPDMLEVVARARELDAFAADHDAQLAVHLRARRSAWTVSSIQQHAARHGFVAGLVPGRLVLPGREDGAPALLVLSFDPRAALADTPSQAVVRDVTLSFDVPQSPVGPGGDEPFRAWQAAAQALSLGMDADVVDDRGLSIDGAGFAAIGADLGRLYESLAARDLAAGSAAARRLFA